MQIAARLASMCLLGSAGLLAGCASIPYSFRIAPADAIEQRILFPPGAEYQADGLVLHIERNTPQCQRGLPTVDTKDIAVSNLYWPSTRSYFLKIAIPEDSAHRLDLLPPARCLNTTVREDVDCPQSTIANKVVKAIEGNSAWTQCIPKDGADLAADIAQVLPHLAIVSGSLREERTYARTGSKLESAEIVQLLPGASICVTRDYPLVPVPGSPTAWVTSRQCTELLDAPDADGKVVLSRTDSDRTFPYANHLYLNTVKVDDSSTAKVHEARSWIAVRAALALDMPRGAFLYIYYSGYGKHNIPPSKQEDDPWSMDEAGRTYPTGHVPPPVPLTPILLVHTQRLKLKGSEPPSLAELCQGSGDKDKKRCFAFPNFAFVDVLRSFSVDGRVQFAPSGTLTSDIPEIRLSRSRAATRLFRGRPVPILFDVTEQHNAIPLAAGDRFGRQP